MVRLTVSKHDLKRSWKKICFGLNSLVGSCRGRFPTKISFDICSRQVLSMRNSCFMFPKPEQLNYNVFLCFKYRTNIFPKKTPKRNLAQYPHRSALQAPYFACAEIWLIAMFLAYQRASRPYKRLVFDDFTFCIFYIFSQFIFLGVGGMRRSL